MFLLCSSFFLKHTSTVPVLPYWLMFLMIKSEKCCEAPLHWLKAQSNEIFILTTFHKSNPPQSVTNRLKYLFIFANNSQSYWNFNFTIRLSGGFRPQGVNKIRHKHDSPGSDTLAILYPQGLIPRWVNLPRSDKWQPGVIGSPGSEFPCGSIFKLEIRKTRNIGQWLS